MISKPTCTHRVLGKESVLYNTLLGISATLPVMLFIPVTMNFAFISFGFRRTNILKIKTSYGHSIAL